jgi:hypothetical protein
MAKNLIFLSEIYPNEKMICWELPTILLKTSIKLNILTRQKIISNNMRLMK